MAPTLVQGEEAHSDFVFPQSFPIVLHHVMWDAPGVGKSVSTFCCSFLTLSAHFSFEISAVYASAYCGFLASLFLVAVSCNKTASLGALSSVMFLTQK